MRELFQNDDDPDSGQQTFHNARGEKAGKKSPLQENQSDLVSLSDATGLVIIPESSAGARAGEEVDVLVLERRFN